MGRIFEVRKAKMFARYDRMAKQFTRFGKEIAIAVHNDGAVIPADRLNGIFNPMKGKEPAGKGAATGSSANLGLGLYIAERIVNAHKGRIDVQSARERGTTFTVHLPRSG